MSTQSPVRKNAARKTAARKTAARKTTAIKTTTRKTSTRETVAPEATAFRPPARKVRANPMPPSKPSVVDRLPDAMAPSRITSPADGAGKAPSPASTAPDVLPHSPADYNLVFGGLLKSMGSGMSVGGVPSIAGWMQMQGDYVRQAADIWNQSLTVMPMSLGGLSGKAAAPAETAPPRPVVQPLSDRRFGAAEWASNPVSAFIARMYLLNAQTLMQMADAVDGDDKTRARLKFAVQQWIDAASPSNNLALNPEALKKAIDTQGQSLGTGLQMLMQDLQKGHVSQTDESVFEVGRNVATTAGSVVYENEFLQLIEYEPIATDGQSVKVHARPMLFVPPCINKYYILDLQPANSIIRHTVEQGHRTFVVSWRNPDESMVAKTWDDYIEHGPIDAIHTVQAITGAKTINTLGFCVGGTILATALAVLAARGEQPAESVTLLTTLLDFSSTGILDIFIDENMVKLREMTIGTEAPGGPGLLKGSELATTFSFLRPNDLVWNYVVSNYLKGEAPPPFDLLYWNGDATNLPGPMYCWYLRHTYLQNDLMKPDRLTVCGEQVDLGRIDAPFFIYGSRDDHIVPWTAAYASVPLLKGPSRFVLGASGHIAGVINPPAKGKRSFWTHDAIDAHKDGSLPQSAKAWFDGATEHPGSWWTTWSEWLASHAGKWTDAPRTPGSAAFKPIEPAPGRYVKVKA